MIEVKPETMDQLSDMLGEDGASEFLEQAESQEQVDQFLAGEVAPEAEQQPDDVVDQNGDQYGWTVVRCRYMGSRYNSEKDENEEVEVDAGWCLRFKGPKRVIYCGKSQAEHLRMESIADPWPDRQLGHARGVCRQKAELMERAPVVSLRRLRIQLVSTSPQLGVCKPKKIQKQLTQRQQDALSTLTEAYKSVPKYDVKNDSDTIATILEVIADALRLKAES